jgi:16S rRNA (cytosine967-C5)-methyltransferase
LRILDDLRNGALLDAAFDRYAGILDSRNRRWLHELVFGTLRTRSRLDALIDPRVTGGMIRLNPILLDLLRLGTYQLLLMGGVPAYAAIAQTVELAKENYGMGAGRLVNAVLRRLDRERENLMLPVPDDLVEALALEFSQPAWLITRWFDQFGEAETRKLLAANNLEPGIHVRPFAISGADLHAELGRSVATSGTSPFLEDGARLAPRVSLTDLGAFRRGVLFVQDPAATLVAKYAAFGEGSSVADLCAAPGGKALEICATVDFVAAGDRSLPRMRRMKENLKRLHAAQIAPFVADAGMPPLREPSCVLLDAPCTGTGTFRRHPDARWRLKPSDIAVMAAQQHDLLRAAAAAVAAGGLLVYSTCSLEAEENDLQVEAFLHENPGWHEEVPPEGSVPTDVLDNGRLRVLPHRHECDGAFAVRLRKRV